MSGVVSLAQQKGDALFAELGLGFCQADEDLARVHLYLCRVLKRATLHWQAAHADPGWLINHRVKGKPCPRCSTKLTTINLIGRKTFIFVRCQQAA